MQAEPMYLDTDSRDRPSVAKVLREQPRRGAAAPVFELCGSCWSPVLAGKLDEHQTAVGHRQPPMGAQSPEG